MGEGWNRMDRMELARIGWKKSRIRETKNLSTDADSRTDIILKRLHCVSNSLPGI